MASIQKPPSTCPTARLAALVFLALALVLVSLGQGRADTAPPEPLRPPDTSSPRATLEGFMDTTAGIQAGFVEVLKSYVSSDRLYPSAEERRQQRAILASGRRVLRYLDLSAISPVLQDTVGPERAVQLGEVLTRIALP